MRMKDLSVTLGVWSNAKIAGEKTFTSETHHVVALLRCIRWIPYILHIHHNHSIFLLPIQSNSQLGR